MKGNLIVALVVGALLGFVLGRATKSPPKQQAVAQVAPQAKPDAPKPARGAEDPNAVYKIPAGNSPSTGPATAKVTIIEVTDFQCPYCARANTTMKQVKETYGDAVRIVVKQNPLSFHQQAHIAAQAALAAHEQGKYWEMHHKLFENSKALDRASLDKYAQELGLDMGRFKAALDSQKYKEQIDAEQRMVVSLGAGGTPSFFINGRKVVGAQPLERFKQVIDEELKKADALLAKGIKAEDVYAEIIKNGATRPVMLPEAAPKAPEKPAAAAAMIQKAEVPEYSPFKGPAHAKVTIVEWSDFECPFCSRGANVAHEIMKAYPNDVKFVFRHQPLSFHKNARPAAKAAMAAHRQGKFWEMHDQLFANAKSLTEENFIAWAKELGLNVDKFKADMADPEIDKQISMDSSDGMKIGASGTPTFFVNGRKVSGAQPFGSFKSIIDEEIRNADTLLAKGVKLEELYEKLTSREAPKLEVGNSPVKGNPKAKVQIFEFSEFQCPFCTRVLPTLKQIEQAYGDQVAIVFKNYPLGFHQHAQLAAEAALAAHEQGKFWQMHDVLFENQKSLERASLEKYAQDIGLDMAKFKAALDSGKFREQVQKDMAAGSSVGVSGTPSFLVNGRLVVGAKPFEEFKAIIDEELAKK
ncbi:MAG: DsbA family protein [Myxococcales bacterium]